jgi:GNAT superfamily N-acetyltransferase
MHDIRTGYEPGCIGAVAQLHGQYYASEWGFDAFFEAKVARELADFMTRYDAQSDAFFSVHQAGQLAGTITIDGAHASTDGAHLRWFIMSDALRGQGYGRALINAAINFCTKRAYSSVYLWTFGGLDGARRLYDDAGFVMVHEQKGGGWGTAVLEQKFVLDLL